MVQTEIMSSQASDQEKYMQMVRILDGSDAQTVEIEIPQDNFDHMKKRLLNIRRCIKRLSEVHSAACLVCSAIHKDIVRHTGGCPYTFNVCYKCLGHHQGKACSSRYFKVAHRFCWKCWMPTYDIFGVSFHTKTADSLGYNCNNETRDFLKPIAMSFFHTRTIVDVSCPCGDITEYEAWLFSASQDSVSGTGQIPNVLLLLEAALAQMKEFL
jgi:hypothetical protein